MEQDIELSWKKLQKSGGPQDLTNFIKLYSYAEDKYGALDSKYILKDALVKVQEFLINFIDDDQDQEILDVIDSLAIKLSISQSGTVLGYTASMLLDLGKYSLSLKKFNYSFWFSEKSIFFCTIGKLFTTVYGLSNLTAANALLELENLDMSMKYSKIAISYFEETLQSLTYDTLVMEKCLFNSYYAYGIAAEKMKKQEISQIWLKKAEQLSKINPEISKDPEIAVKILRISEKFRNPSRCQKSISQHLIRFRPAPKKPRIPKKISSTTIKKIPEPYKTDLYPIKHFRLRDPRKSFIENFETTPVSSLKNLQSFISFPKFNESKSISKCSEKESSLDESQESSILSNTFIAESEQPRFKDVERIIMKRPNLQLTHTRTHKIVPEVFHRVLIMKEVAYFMYALCEFFFYYTKQSKVITTEVTYEGRKYSLDYKITSEKALTEIIKQDILPYLDLNASQELVIGILCKMNYIEGYFYLNNINGLLSFKLQQPRSNLVVEFEINKKNMTLTHTTSILLFSEQFKKNFFELNKLNLLLYYSINNNKVEPHFPTKGKLELLYYNKEFTDNDKEYYFKISAIEYADDKKFLVESINSFTKKSTYCVVNMRHLKEVYNINCEITGQNIEFLTKILAVKYGQVQLIQKFKEENISAMLRNKEKSKKMIIQVQKVLRGKLTRKGSSVYKGITIYPKLEDSNQVLTFVYDSKEDVLKIHLFHDELEYLLKIEAPIPLELPYYKSISRSLKLSPDPLLSFGNFFAKFSIVDQDLMNSSKIVFDRLIYRTGIRISDQNYIVSMSLSKSQTEGIILVFKIQCNVVSDSASVITIDLNTISEKTEIPKHKLIKIGAFVVNRMLVIKGPNLMYIDLSRCKVDEVKIAIKIQSFFRGYMVRKHSINKEKGKLLIKKKVCLRGENWTVLCYDINVFIELKLVQTVGAGIKNSKSTLNPRKLICPIVLTTLLSKFLIEAQCSLSDLDLYIINSIIPSIFIDYIGGKPEIKGLETIQHNLM